MALCALRSQLAASLSHHNFIKSTMASFNPFASFLLGGQAGQGDLDQKSLDRIGE